MIVKDDSFEVTRYLTKQDLIEANNAAIREKRNKILAKDFVESLPDDFIFVVFWEYYHNKYEMRLGITIDLKGDWVLLDVSKTRFESLPRSKTYKDGRVELESPENTKKRRPYPDREWQETQTKKPTRKQNKFRKIVLDAYENRCSVCDVDTPVLLRAAHIIPVVNGGNDSIENGICLCANHEIAFDAGLLRIYSDNTAFLYDEFGQETEQLRLRLPVDEKNYPSPDNLTRKLKLLGY